MLAGEWGRCKGEGCRERGAGQVFLDRVWREGREARENNAGETEKRKELKQPLKELKKPLIHTKTKRTNSNK
jgi:hypothetical protein